MSAPARPQGLTSHIAPVGSPAGSQGAPFPSCFIVPDCLSAALLCVLYLCAHLSDSSLVSLVSGHALYSPFATQCPFLAPAGSLSVFRDCVTTVHFIAVVGAHSPALSAVKISCCLTGKMSPWFLCPCCCVCFPLTAF